jgi:uridine kinase
MKPVIIGVAGGTGSGKTTVVQEIVSNLGSDQVRVIQHDAYYKDRSDLLPAEREHVNYDHPDALETKLLVHHLRELIAGRPVEVPIHDSATHVRKQETRRIEPRKAIILEGILVLAEQSLRELTNIRVFVDTDDDIRFIRRLQRDITERGRTVQSIIEQYLATVKPMHLEFVEPSKRYADAIIPEGGYNQVAVDMLGRKIRTVLLGG